MRNASLVWSPWFTVHKYSGIENRGFLVSLLGNAQLGPCSGFTAANEHS